MSTHNAISPSMQEIVEEARRKHPEGQVDGALFLVVRDFINAGRLPPNLLKDIPSHEELQPPTTQSFIALLCRLNPALEKTSEGRKSWEGAARFALTIVNLDETGREFLAAELIDQAWTSLEFALTWVPGNPSEQG